MNSYVVVLNGHDAIREALVKRSTDFVKRSTDFVKRSTDFVKRSTDFAGRNKSYKMYAEYIDNQTRQTKSTRQIR